MHPCLISPAFLLCHIHCSSSVNTYWCMCNLQLDVAIDGADEVDKNLNCIKGGG